MNFIYQITDLIDPFTSPQIVNVGSSPVKYNINMASFKVLKVGLTAEKFKTGLSILENLS